MKILKHGNLKSKRLLQGECDNCGCSVQCHLEETKYLHDRDTPEGGATRYVTCPECHTEYLWVK